MYIHIFMTFVPFDPLQCKRRASCAFLTLSSALLVYIYKHIHVSIFLYKCVCVCVYIHTHTHMDPSFLNLFSSKDPNLVPLRGTSGARGRTALHFLYINKNMFIYIYDILPF